MKMKDLKPGMTVAKRADSWMPNAVPDRLVVLSTEYHNGKRTYSRTSDEREVTFTVTADDNGEQHRVRTPVYTPGGADKAKVLVLNTTNGNRVEWLTPAQVEGPYRQVRDERAVEHRRSVEARLRSEERRVEQTKRANDVIAGLAILGFKYASSDHRIGTRISLSLEEAERLLRRLAALDDLARRMDEEV